MPADQYAQVTLRNLDGSGHLTGSWVNVRGNTGAAAYSTTNTFSYDRSDDRFEQVNAYYAVDVANTTKPKMISAINMSSIVPGSNVP